MTHEVPDEQLPMLKELREQADRLGMSLEEALGYVDQAAGGDGSAWELTDGTPLAPYLESVTDLEKAGDVGDMFEERDQGND
jgi:hypothetical protein